MNNSRDLSAWNDYTAFTGEWTLLHPGRSLYWCHGTRPTRDLLTMKRKRLSGIFKILGSTLLHLLSGVHVTNTSQEESSRVTLAPCTVVYSYWLGLLLSTCPAPLLKAPVLTTVPKCALKDSKPYIISGIMIMAGCNLSSFWESSVQADAWEQSGSGDHSSAPYPFLTERSESASFLSVLEWFFFKASHFGINNNRHNLFISDSSQPTGAKVRAWPDNYMFNFLVLMQTEMAVWCRSYKQTKQ